MHEVLLIGIFFKHEGCGMKTSNSSCMNWISNDINDMNISKKETIKIRMNYVNINGWNKI